MKKKLIMTTIILTLFFCTNAKAASRGTTLPCQQTDSGYYVDQQEDVVDWLEEFGSHRTHIIVREKTDGVLVHIPWRRRDPDPQDKDVVIIHGDSGERMKNVIRIEINNEFGDLFFEPTEGAGEYYVYYLPFKMTSNWGGEYATPQQTADSAWIQRSGKVIDALRSKDKTAKIPQAEVLEIQARNEFDRFTVMEIIATASETEQFITRNRDKDYLLFPEDRKFVIRMTDRLPLRWITNGPASKFKGTANRNEYYAFQIGLYAHKKSIEKISINFNNLLSTSNASTIKAGAITCFNFGGTDWMGQAFTKEVSVEKAKVQPLWFGIDIPKNAAAGDYHGTITLGAENASTTKIDITLTVLPRVLQDRGDSQLWRHSRLRWLNSTIAIDDNVTAPYTPLKVSKQTVSCLGRQLRFGSNGLPQSIRSFGNEILSGPVNLFVETKGRTKAFESDDFKFLKRSDGQVVWRTVGSIDTIDIDCIATMEFDGSVDFDVTVKAVKDVSVRDIRLEIPMQQKIATYMMGLGRSGGFRPKEWKWKWDIDKHQDKVWLGNTMAGLQCYLKDENYHRPPLGPEYFSKPLHIPESWDNNNRGGLDIFQSSPETLTLRAYSGPRQIEAGQQLQFNFRLLITPFKPIDSAAHFQTRYYHQEDSSLSKILASEANVANIHHSWKLNPFINYPFILVDELRNYIDAAHEKDVKVKLYYTVRELTNHAAELFAMLSLNEEIFYGGSGGGYAWLQEHLPKNYDPAWCTRIGFTYDDAAIANVSESRWLNYYLEGLAWLVKNQKIDGLYIDDVSFSRSIMQRVRKIMNRYRPGCLIDLHSSDQFYKLRGWALSTNLYLEHFPYIDSLWFGEHFNYNGSPDFWLIELSGIPFGLMGEMLNNKGWDDQHPNQWRGMIYGMSSRVYSDGNPTPLWKFWKDFGIAEARMVGYWDKSCPVKTNHKDILATAYVKDNETLIAIASWAKETENIKLEIDITNLGVNGQKATLRAPAIQNYQNTAEFKLTDQIPVKPGKGWLLILKD